MSKNCTKNLILASQNELTHTADATDTHRDDSLDVLTIATLTQNHSDMTVCIFIPIHVLKDSPLSITDVQEDRDQIDRNGQKKINLSICEQTSYNLPFPVLVLAASSPFVPLCERQLLSTRKQSFEHRRVVRHHVLGLGI